MTIDTSEIPVDLQRMTALENPLFGESEQATLLAEYEFLMKETEDLRNLESEVDDDTFNHVVIPAVEDNIILSNRLKACVDSAYWENKEDTEERAKIETVLAQVHYRLEERERRKAPREKVSASHPLGPVSRVT